MGRRKAEGVAASFHERRALRLDTRSYSVRTFSSSSQALPRNVVAVIHVSGISDDSVSVRRPRHEAFDRSHAPGLSSRLRRFVKGLHVVLSLAMTYPTCLYRQKRSKHKRHPLSRTVLAWSLPSEDDPSKPERMERPDTTEKSERQRFATDNVSV